MEHRRGENIRHRGRHLLAGVAHALLLTVAAGGAWTGCNPGDRCSADGDCSEGAVCEEGSCVGPDWRVGGDAGPDGSEARPDIEAPDELQLSASAVDERAERTVDLRNRGGATLRVDRVGLERGAAFTVTFPTASPPFELEPDSSRPIRIVYEPTGAGEARDTMAIESNDPDEPTTEIDITGSVDDDFDGPCVKYTPEDALEFGPTDVGTTGNATVELKNCSTSQPLRIDRAEANPSRVFGTQLDGQTSVSPGETHRQEVRFSPRESKSYTGTLEIATNVPGLSNIEIPLRGEGTVAQDCPSAKVSATPKASSGSGNSTDLTFEPMTTLSLDGTASTSPQGSIGRYEWTILDRPEGSAAQITPSGAAEPEVLLDLVGSYTFELTVYDTEGTASCETAVVDATAEPPSDIYVELVWDTPNDNDQNDGNGPDLDLHYLNPNASSWNEAPWDIFWNNAQADWGRENDSSDDPEMFAIDENDGGPESVMHDDPKDGAQYTVGVYYYEDSGFGGSYATTRLYVNKSLAREFSSRFLKQYWFWEVADIDWPSGNIAKRDEVTKSGFPQVN